MGCCFAAGLVIAAALGIILLTIAVSACLLLVIYSRYLKGIPLVGNAAVALTAAMAFVYGGAAVNGIGAALWAAWLAFLFHLGREIIKDMEDREGDAAAGARTLPVHFGLTAARLWITLVFFCVVISLPLPYTVGGYREGYLVLALAGVFPVVAVITVQSWIWSQPRRLHYLSEGLKWDMLVGMLALYIGRPNP